MKSRCTVPLIPFALISTALASDPSASTSPTPVPPPTGLIQPLWQVREVRMDSRSQTLLSWKAERIFETQQALLTRNKLIGALDGQPSPAGNPLTIALQPATDSRLRDKVQTLILRIPNRDEGPISQEECPHWIELESVTGKKLICDKGAVGTSSTPESKAALDLVQDLRRLTNDDVPSPSATFHPPEVGGVRQN